MYNLIWSRNELTPKKLGTFCEYYAKMSLTSYGLDIYTSEVDDHGIDFVAETKIGFLKFQVKSIRRTTTQYVFMQKKNFDITDLSLYLILILLKDNSHPAIYVIPASAWTRPSTTKLFVYHSYEGKKSAPEYGVNVSEKNMAELDQYNLGNMIKFLA